MSAKNKKNKVDKNQLNKIQNRVMEKMSWVNTKSSNLYIDDNRLDKGEKINAGHQQIKVPKDSIMVFADDAPLYNWGHPCRYMFFDQESSELIHEERATFPPTLENLNDNMIAFHTPVLHVRRPMIPVERKVHLAELIGDKLRFYPARGKRYAILYSGASNNRHVNDMEFLYRTLIDVYDFDPDNIIVLNYNGTTAYSGSVSTIWPGDDTPYRMIVNGSGTKSEFEGALDDVKSRLNRNDFLLIHMNNHGGHNGTESYVCAYSGSGYTASDFASKLSTLPNYAQLMVMLEQCHSGGFNIPIRDYSTADETSVASACEEHRSSIGGPEFDPFARDWISAVTGVDPYGHALVYDPNTNGDGVISAKEAFNYANTVKDPYDTPIYHDDPLNCGKSMHLGRPDPVIILDKIRDYIKLFEVESRKPVPDPDPGPIHLYDDLVRRVGELEKMMRHRPGG